MSDQHNEPIVIGEFSSEFEAALVKNRLVEAGIPCEISGVYTAGFRAEAPGMVRVLVPYGFEERARVVLEED